MGEDSLDTSSGAPTRKHKPQRHHWWPECVSMRWADADGYVNWLLPNGEARRAPPKKFGAIRNGHLIQLSRLPGEETVWDENFEHEFDRADGAFPSLIDWLETLDRSASAPSMKDHSRFRPQPADEAQLRTIADCVVSLAVRSPMNRSAAVRLAEHLRGSLPERERKMLIGANMRRTQREASDAIGSRAKFVVIYSPDRELIFGDGFFHNVRSPVSTYFSPRIVAPLTPNLAVGIVRPTQYRPDPKLVTMVVTKAEADVLNGAVQVYARDALFYRFERPIVDDNFRRAAHLEYNHPDNPMDKLLLSLPGIPPRDASFDHLFVARNRV